MYDYSEFWLSEITSKVENDLSSDDDRMGWDLDPKKRIIALCACYTL